MLICLKFDLVFEEVFVEFLFWKVYVCEELVKEGVVFMFIYVENFDLLKGVEVLCIVIVYKVVGEVMKVYCDYV